MSAAPEPGRDGIESRDVACPTCGETVQIFLESDLRGEMVQDCEVCCHPWRVRVATAADGLRVEVRGLDE